MNKKILGIFVVTVLIVTMGATSLIGSVIAGKGTDKLTFYWQAVPVMDMTKYERAWTSPLWETPVYPPTFGSPEVVHYRGIEGTVEPGTLIIKIDGEPLAVDIDCQMFIDMELHKPVWIGPPPPLVEVDFVTLKTTKIHTFDVDGLTEEDTIVTVIKNNSKSGGDDYIFNGYGTGYFKNVKIIKGTGTSGPRIDEGIIMGWPGLPTP